MANALCDPGECHCPQLERWREAVIDELVCAHIYERAHDTDPKKAIGDAIAWNVAVALDPAVSSDAAKLRDTYLAERDAIRQQLAGLEAVVSWCPRCVAQLQIVQDAVDWPPEKGAKHE